MGLMGSLYVGASGLQTSQNALNTTAHNMANIDTVGYTRQQVQQGTRIYNTISKNGSAISRQQIGLGVNYTHVKQIRDYFLDKAYRAESGRGAFYETSARAFEEIQDIFQELEGQSFSKAIGNLWGSVQDLAGDPANPVNQGVFIQRCSEFITRASAVYTGLSEYQDNLNYKIKQQVDKINDYGKRIQELNAEILKIEAAGVEKANDLKDEKNRLIDELSKMGDISVSEDPDGNSIIRFEGKDFVTADSVNQIALHTDEITGFYTPYWKQLATTTQNPDGSTSVNIAGATLFNDKQTINTDTGVGSLKSMIFARGDHRATYEDINNPNYSRDIEQSAIMNAQAEFDQLINKITTAINKVFKDAADAAKALDPNSKYMCGSDGQPFQIFETMTNEVDAGGQPFFSVGNIKINAELKQSPSLLGFIKPDTKVDQETADKLKKIFTEEIYTLNPSVKTKTNFVDYYDNLISQFANGGSIMRGISENQQVTVDNIGAAREQVLGVSSEEEMGFMIMFQNAYNASSRYINVVSELLEHIITTLGR